MDRDARFASEPERDRGRAEPQRGRKRGSTRRLWNLFELIEVLSYLLWGLGKLFFRGILHL